jgi:hypothetical protein
MVMNRARPASSPSSGPNCLVSAATRLLAYMAPQSGPRSASWHRSTKTSLSTLGGRDTGSLRAALTVSDVVLVPVQPRSFDIWALDAMAALIAEAREINPELRALAFLNAADAQGRDNGQNARNARI